MQKKEITDLLNISGTPCLTLIIPTHRTNPERIKDEAAVHQIEKLAIQVIKLNFGETKEVEAMLQNLSNQVHRIDFVHPKDGIGIYITPKIAVMIKFPFPVVQKLKIGNTFDHRDLLYYYNLLDQFGLVSVSKKEIRLFTGVYDQVTEIANEDFPYRYQETYEYARPVKAHSFGSGVMKEFEKDKSVIEEIRLKDMIRATEMMMGKYLPNNAPLIVCGGPKEVHNYMEVTKYLKRVAGKFHGNQHPEGDHKMAATAHEQMQQFRQNQNDILLDNFRELVGKEMVAIGLEEIWDAAISGNALQLLIEKDLECAAFIKIDGTDLKLTNHSNHHEYEYVADAVERAIKLVREKGGHVLFMNNKALEEFGGMALQMRYNPRIEAN